MERVRALLRQSVPAVVALGALNLPAGVMAGEIQDSYATDQTLTVEMMNNIKSAVNDNHTRIGAVQGSVSALQTETADLPQIRAAISALGTTQGCAGNNPEDAMVQVGPLCVDKYEASLWKDQTSGAAVAAPSDCASDGGDCTFAAQSRVSVTPAADVTYLQALAACANAGKRLLGPAEFQMAALGTPAIACNVSSRTLADTGSIATCVSRDHGNGARTYDMVGNLYEYVDVIVPTAGGLSMVGFMGSAYDTAASNPQQASAQRFYTNANPSQGYPFIGFRCAR